MASEFDFTNKVVLITGSSGGLGSNIAREFAKRGANVVITGRNQEVVQKVANECTSLSPNSAEAFPYVADVTKTDSLKCLVGSVIQKFGHLDVLVNNAGGGAFSSIYDEKLLDTLDHMITLDLKSVVALTQIAVPHLEKTNGAIVNISSILGQRPNAPFMPYCVAKAAVDMFSKCIAVELGPKGVRVNCVSPTAIRTGFQAGTGAGESLAAHLQHLEETIPLRRIATVDDVTNAVLFLASNKASFITGDNLVVDGGNSHL